MEDSNVAQIMEDFDKNIYQGKDDIIYIKSPDSENVSDVVKKSCNNITKHNIMCSELFGLCKRINCPLAEKGLGRCIPTGYINSDTMLIDAYPDEYEACAGCFTGNKGYILAQALELAHKNFNDIYCTTVLKCNNLQETNQNIVDNCIRMFCMSEIERIKPKKIIFTYSAYQVALKYNILQPVGGIQYFQPRDVVLLPSNLSTIVYICYDFNNNKDTIKSLIQGLQMIL